MSQRAGPFTQPQDPKVAAKQRRLAVLLLIGTMSGICVLLVFSAAQPDVVVALEIFMASVVCFTGVAILTYDAALYWRFVDFPWLCTSFAAIVVALVNVSNNSERADAALAKQNITTSLSNLIYEAQIVVTNDCQQLPILPSRPRKNEPYEGACKFLAGQLPQLTYALAYINANDNPYGFEVLTTTLFDTDNRAQDSWSLQKPAKDFLTVLEANESKLLKKKAEKPDWLQKLVLTGNFRYWYFLMAFFVGLRLSKTTAEVLQAKASAKRT